MNSISEPSGSRKIDRSLRPFGAKTLQWSALDRNSVRLEVRDRAFDRALPFEAKIAVARLHRQPRNLLRGHARPVHIELLVAKSIGPADRPRDQLPPSPRYRTC